MNKIFKRLTTAFVGIAMAIGVGSASIAGNNVREARADSYTITFKTGSGDGSSVSTSTKSSDVVATNSTSYVKDNVQTATNAYYGGGSGLKLGKSGGAGVLKMNLASSITPTSVVVNAKRYNDSKAVTLSANGATAQSLTTAFADYTFSITSQISFIQLNSSQYCWVKSVTINYSGGDTPSVTNHTVTFDGTDMDAVQVEHGHSIDRPENDPTRDNYTFIGWYTSDSYTQTVSFPLTINEDTTIYAKWEKSTYSVTYDANGATSGTAPDDDTSIPRDDASVYQLAGQGDLLKTGFEFDGWAKTATGPKVYEPEDIIDLTETDEDLDLFAHWNKVVVPNQIVFADEGLADGEKYSIFGTNEDTDGKDRSAMLFTTSFSGGAHDGKYYNTGTGIRTYKNNGTITISAKNSKKLGSITFVWGTTYKPLTDKFSVDSGSYDASTGVWTGEASQLVLTNTNTEGDPWRLQSITVALAAVKIKEIILDPSENIEILSTDLEAKTIDVVVDPDDADNKTLSVTSSNTDVAVVNVSSIANGEGSFTITGKGATSGTSTITVAATDDSGISEQIIVTAKDASAPILTGVEVQANEQEVQHIQYVGHDFNPAGLTFVPQYDKENPNPDTITAESFNWSELEAGVAVVGTLKSNGDIHVTIQTSIVEVRANTLTVTLTENENKQKIEYTIMDAWDIDDLVSYSAQYADGTDFVPQPNDGFEFIIEPETPMEYYNTHAEALEITAFAGNEMSETVSIDDLTVTYVSHYKKVQEDITDYSGQYLIVYESSETAGMAFNGGLDALDAENSYIEVNMSGGYILSNETVDAASFNIQRKEDKYTIQSSSGKYIGKDGSGNGLETSETTKYINTISVESGVASIKAKNNGYLRFNSANNQKRFRYYGSGQQSVSLYRYDNGITPIPTSERIPVTGVSLNQSSLELTVGDDPVTLTATVAPENATVKDVFWVSGNNNVVTVENGVVTPVKSGETTITVKTIEHNDNDAPYTAICTVTVNRATPQADHGTEESPIKVSDAIALIDAYGGEDSLQDVYVKGIISELPAANKIVLANDLGEGETLTIFGYQLAEALSGVTLSVGLEIVAKGYTKIYVDGQNNNIYQMGGVQGHTPLVLSAVDPEEVLSIELIGEVGKTDYLVNEQLDLGTLQVRATMANNVIRIVDITNDMVSGFDSKEAVSGQLVTITYGGKTATFSVNIAEPATLESVSVTHLPTKVVYEYEEAEDLTGLEVSAVYSDNTSIVLSPDAYTVTGFDSTIPGEQTITVTYQGLTDTYIITINEPVVPTKIEVTSGPTKTEYKLGDELDLSGLVVTVTYSNDTTAPLDVTPDMISGYNKNQSGEQTITITYEQLTATFKITIAEPTYQKVTNVEDVKSYSTYGLTSDGYVYATTTVTDSYIKFTGDTELHFTLVATEGGYYLKTADGKYINSEPSGAKVSIDSTATTVWTLASNENGVYLVNTSGRYLANTANGIRAYALSNISSTAPVYVVLVEEGRALDSIAVTTAPDKTVYERGEELDVTGMKITATFTDQSTEVIDVELSMIAPGFDSSTPGTVTITIIYEVEGVFKQTTFELTIKEPELTSISLDGPNKTTYELGEDFDNSSVSVIGNYSDGSTAPITEGFTFSEFDMETVGEKNVTVTYGEFTAEFTINVVETLILDHIELDTEEVKKIYEQLNEPDWTGLVVTAVYTNGKSNIVTDYVITGFDSTIEPGVCKITVSYTDKDIEATATFDVVITEPTVTKVEIKTPATKTVYETTDELDVSGLVITVSYSNGTSEDVTVTPNMISGFDSSKVSEKQTLTVTYKGGTVTYDIVINRKPRYQAVASIEAVNTNTVYALSIDDVKYANNSAENAVIAYGNEDLDELKIILVATTNGYYLMTQDGKYINSNSSSGTGVSFLSTPGAGSVWKLEAYNDGVMLVNANGGRYLGKDRSSDVIKAYAKGSKNVNLTTYLPVYLHVVPISAMSVKAPTKTSYFVGQELDLEGMVVTVTAKYGDYEVKGNAISVSGFNSEEAGEVTVTVKYLDKEATFTVNVIVATAESISVTGPTKTSYFVGDTFDPAGLAVTENYNDGSTKAITEGYTLSEVDMNTAGEKVITVTYGEFTAEFKITVLAIEIESIEVSGPTKTTYTVGDEFDPAGLVVTAVYNNGDRKVIESGYTLSEPDMTTAGGQVISVTYEGFIATFRITVSEPVIIESISVTGPKQTTYVTGEELTLTGLVVTANYSDGTTKVIETGYVVDVASIDMSTVGEKVISVTYEGFIATFKITVNERVVETSISVTGPTKTVYTVGERLDTTGLVVTVHFSNDSTQVLSEGYTLSQVDMSTAGEKTIIVTYGEFTAEFKITVNEPVVLQDIRVSGPTKTTYEVGEELDLTGLVVTGVYSNGETATITEGYTLSAVDMSVAGEKTIVVTYGELTAEFKITVNEPVVLEDIRVTAPTKTEYEVGEELDLTGLVVTGIYSNGDTAPITEGYTLSSVDMSVAGEKTIVVTYGEFTAEFKITVNEPITIERISVTAPTKVVYEYGEELDLSGLAVSVVYSNGDTAPITEGYTLSTVDMTVAGEKTIVVTYGEFTAEFKITVNEQQPSEEATLVSIEVVSMPTKTSYMVGEEIDLTGLVVKATYSDGVVNTLSIDELIVVVDNLHPGLISVSISYQDEEITQSTSFNVTFSRDKTVVLGCHGSVVATSALISITSLLGAGLLLLKKRKIK